MIKHSFMCPADSNYIIPKNVKHVTFPNNVCQPIKEGDISYGVTHLNFGCRFNQPLHLLTFQTPIFTA